MAAASMMGLDIQSSKFDANEHGVSVGDKRSNLEQVAPKLAQFGHIVTKAPADVDRLIDVGAWPPLEWLRTEAWTNANFCRVPTCLT